MPKAAAVPPLEWATTHPGLGTFDLGELNRVVLDYAYIELRAADRWTRRTALGRVCGALLQCLTVIGVLAAVLLGITTAAGVDGEALVIVVYAGAGLGCAALAACFVPWVLTPYRQWDRTLCGIAVMMIVIAAVSIGSILARSPAAGPRWVLVAPCLLLLLMAIGAVVGDFRWRTAVKPPTVDLDGLSPEQIGVLLASRRKALKVLRSRSVVAYGDFDAFDSAPLQAPEPRTR